MKALVLNAFRDKYTLELFVKGAEIEVTAERFAEINGASAGVLVKEMKGRKRKEG